MSNLLRYKGYLGSVQYSEENNCFFGKLLNGPDLVNYEGANREELEKAFKEAVDDYLELKKVI